MLQSYVFYIEFLVLKVWVIVPTIKSNKVKLETQENKDNIFCGMLKIATLIMIVLKQANNPPIICSVGFETNDLIYHIHSYAGKVPKS